MSVSDFSRLQSQLIAAQDEVIKYQNAAHINHEKWQEEVARRHSESLDAVAALYVCSGDDLRTLVHGFGKLTFEGLTLEDVIDALLEKYEGRPIAQEQIRAAFGRL